MTKWCTTTEERYDEMLGVLPPAAQSSYGFLMGEPTDHEPSTGLPRYSAFVELYGQRYASLQPITVRQFNSLTVLAVLNNLEPVP